jgi:alkylation response protein AidB-like acyl-CoA dehydrogenase
MDMRLDAVDRELQDRARTFTERFLIPNELECEFGGGLPPETLESIRRAVVEQGWGAINHSVDDGGRGLDLMQQILVQEEMGKATGALWDVVWRPAIPLREGTVQQRERYLRPACRGERRDAYAITEEGAGSDPTMIRTTAKRDGDGYVIDGEKWHVTAGDVADFILVHALVDGDRELPALFIVDRDMPGVRVVRTPAYMHTFVFEHPVFAFEEVRVGPERVLGRVGEGYELTKDWFVEERLMIAARTVGASIRALELSATFAKSRRAFGRPIEEYQGVEFMLADMATEIMAAKSLLYRVGWEAARAGASRPDLHRMAAAAKVVCSETAGRVVDRAVQIHGGRGYMREEPVERLWRELRVDRIWEGTSEIQRSIVGREIRTRGPGVFTGWPHERAQGRSTGREVGSDE